MRSTCTEVSVGQSRCCSGRKLASKVAGLCSLNKLLTVEDKHRGCYRDDNVNQVKPYFKVE